MQRQQSVLFTKKRGTHSNIKLNSLQKIQKLNKEKSPRKSISLSKIPEHRNLHDKPEEDSSRQYSMYQEKHIDRMRKSFMKANQIKSKGLLSPLKLKDKLKIELSSQKNSPTIRQYETFLKVSSQSWLVFDYRKDSYTRGWKVADIDDFSGLIRFVLLKLYIQLVKINKNIPQYQTRVNIQNLKRQIDILRQQKKPYDKRRGHIYRQYKDRCFIDNTIVKITDLMHGLFMTKFQDIVEYAVITLGYLAHCISRGIDPTSQKRFFYVQEIPEALTYKKYFGEYIEAKIFPSLQMKDSKINEHYFYSTPNDICRLYLAIENQQIFRTLISCKEETWHIKYQVGFRYWENRTLFVKNTRIDLGSDYLGTFCWQSKKQYAAIIKNQILQILIILGDCRYGMTEPDVRLIEQWIRSTRKPIIDMRKTHLKLLPILRISKNSTENLQTNIIVKSQVNTNAEQNQLGKKICCEVEHI